MIEATLIELDRWYQEPEAQNGDRSKLLSKLALLEFCGWIEGEFDQLILDAEKQSLQDSEWCHENIIKSTTGFQYEQHFRRMFSKLFGEITARQIETEMERRHPGDLERLKSLLGTLWKKRCSFAHTDVSANVIAQQTFDAPSWSLKQYAAINELINKFKVVLFEVLP
jgi:hypothetical protein